MYRKLQQFLKADLKNLQLQHRGGGMNLYNIAHLMPDQALTDRRLVGNRLQIIMRFHRAGNRIHHFFIIVHIQDFDTTANGNNIRRDLVAFNDLDMLELVFQLLDTRFNNGLLILAASYSLFSERSPKPRATRIFSEISPRVTLLSSLSSFFSAS